LLVQLESCESLKGTSFGTGEAPQYCTRTSSRCGQRPSCAGLEAANWHCLYWHDVQRPPSAATPGPSRINFCTGAAWQYRARPSLRNGHAITHFRRGFFSEDSASEGSTLSPPSAIVSPNPGTDRVCKSARDIAHSSASRLSAARALCSLRAHNSQPTAPVTTRPAKTVIATSARFITCSQNVQSFAMIDCPPCR